MQAEVGEAVWRRGGEAPAGADARPRPPLPCVLPVPGSPARPRLRAPRPIPPPARRARPVLTGPRAPPACVPSFLLLLLFLSLPAPCFPAFPALTHCLMPAMLPPPFLAQRPPILSTPRCLRVGLPYSQLLFVMAGQIGTLRLRKHR